MKLAATVAASLIATPAFAKSLPPPDPIKMDAIDFSVDFKELIKKRVTVTGCRFGGANSFWIFCYATNNPGVQINVETKTLDKEDRRRALRECAGVLDENERCTGAVTGEAFDFMGVGPAVRKAKITWDKQ